MLLNQLVEINQKGLVARAVSFELMDNVEKNLRLCEGFVFNHDSERNSAKQTTVGILDAIRRSFHSPNEPNIHLIVQDYGKGKSHFALAVANFFKLPCDRPEVEGILDQIKCATSENNATLQELTAYKQRGRHLVLCLSATDVIDMQKHFFEVLNKELEANGITDAIAQQICREPLQFLQRLDHSQRQKAEEYLRHNNFSTSIFDLENRLTNYEFQVIPTVKSVCRELTGVNPDFSTEIKVSKIFDDLVNKLCKGKNPTFQGILILFDELHAYLQRWSADSIAAGGLFLQSVTDACEKYQGKIALVSLTQRRPSGFRPSKNHEDYKKLSERLETSNTYNPKASLELVLDGLLKQQPKGSSVWQSFEKEWGNHLRNLSTEVFNKYASEYYKGLNWKHEDFYKYLVIGCFPLHPLTSYLLCNLAFTQGRSAIDFVQKEVRDFIFDRPVKDNGQLNFIYPIALVDAFEGNFANSEANTEYTSVFSDYNYSLSKVQASSDSQPEEIAILKALLLFYTSSGRLKKSDNERHEEVLKSLTGLTAIRISEVIQKLWKVREVIYHNPADNTYKFYSGGKGIDEVRQRVKEESKYQKKSISTVETYCNENIALLTKLTTTPTQFIEVKRLRSEDWFFKNEVFSIKNFHSLLQKKQPFKSNDKAGLVAYVIAETDEEIAQLYKDIEKLIAQHPHRDQIAVAIAVQPVETLLQLLLEKLTVNDPSKFPSQDYGAALTQLKSQYAKQVDNATKELFASFTYYAHIIDEIPLSDRTSISIVVSEILERSYSLIPPIEGSDKLALKSTSGSEVIGDITKRLSRGDLYSKDLPTKAIFKNIIDPVFAKSWGLLRLVNEQYKVFPPSNLNVKEGWDKLSEMTALGDRQERIIELTLIYSTLSSTPYGYNPYTFTILLAGWMAYHRSEIFLKGTYGISTSQQQNISTKPLKDWADTNIFDKPKDFVGKWIISGKSQLIRRKSLPTPSVPDTLNYNEAIELRNQISTFFITNSSDKFQKLTEQDKLLERACLKLEQDFEPASRVETLIESKSISEWSDVEEFIDLYSELQKSLSVIAENGITVTPSVEQDRRYTEALQSALREIGDAVEIESERHTTLLTEEDCGTHKANLVRAIAQINTIEALPDRFIDALNSSLVKTDRVLEEIINERKSQQCIAEIQRLHKTLSDMATQQDYVRTQEEIVTLANTIPIVKDKDIYKTVIANIEEKQDSLVQQVIAWEVTYTAAMPRIQANVLKENISRQRDRYTNEISQKRLEELLQSLDNIILERQSEEGDEKVLQTLLSGARGKLNDIKTLKNPIDSMQAYLQLYDIKLTSNQNGQQELQDIKSEGFTVLTQKLSQVIDLCKRKLDQPKDYEQRKSALTKLEELTMSSDEFISLRLNLVEGIKELETQYIDLQNRLKDIQTMQSIRQLSSVKANTLRQCEDAIADIETAQQQLNYPERFLEEINKQIQAFKGKIIAYEENLKSIGEELISVDDSNQLNRLRGKYHRLELIFKDSNQFSIYQQFEIQISILDEDIKVITQLQDLSSNERANTLLACDHAIAQIDHVSPTLLETERFAVKLQQLKETLQQRKQSYLFRLTEFRDGLSNATTSKETKLIRKQVLEASSFYQNSDESANFESISTEADLLVGLLQLFESQKTDIQEDCATELHKLKQWQETNTEITSMLRSRVETKLEELTTKLQTLQESQRKSAKAWYERIQLKITATEQSIDDTEKISLSGKLLKQIEKDRSQNEEFLEEAQKQEIDRAIAFCNDIQSLDREAKIFDLFQELPRSKREILLKRLADRLYNPMENDS